MLQQWLTHLLYIEYLYNKDKELKERSVLEKKIKIKQAIESDKPIPNELRKDAEVLKNELEHDDVSTLVQKTHIDDEYEEAKYKDPKIMVTTSRSPSSRLMQFQKVSHYL